MLTRRQKKVLDFIVSYMRESGGVSPSFTEIRKAMETQSQHSVQDWLGALEERGFIRRMPERARAIEVLRTTAPPPQVEKTKRTKRIKRTSRDITIPKCGEPPSVIKHLCPDGKISGAHQWRQPRAWEL